MLSLQEDWLQSRENYYRTATGVSVDGQRDYLYQACVCLPGAEPEVVRAVDRRLGELELTACPYSGLPAVQLLTQFKDQLSEEARQALRQFLKASRQSWLEELEVRKYNSYRLLSIVSLLGIDVLFRDPEAADAAREALQDTLDHCKQYSLPDEFLAPFYTGLQLAALAEIRQLPVDDDCRRLAEELEDFIWQGVLRHYEPGILELLGPHCRGYTSELAGHFQVILACIRSLLGDEAGFTFVDTLWDPGYADKILPHGTLEAVRLYALYFSAFSYRCKPETLTQWRQRELPCSFTETAHTDASRDRSIKEKVADSVPFDYPEGIVHITSLLDDGFALGWADREYENGMACPSLQVFYRKNGTTKAFFPRLVREDRYVGEWNEYPNLHLKLGPGNFPDDGRKTVERVGDALRLTYRPRKIFSDVDSMKLDLIFASHFSMPDRVLVDGEPLTSFDGNKRYPVTTITVEDAGWRFRFVPLSTKGHMKFVLRNDFLDLEWVQSAETGDAMLWQLDMTVEKLS